MRAVIPVAGVGTRLRPHTYSQPKVLLNVGGKPILGHILDALREQKVMKATIITGYMGSQVKEYVTKKYSDMEFDFVEQKERLGLGHAIQTGKDTYNDEPLLIILGDTIFDVDLSLAVKSGNSSLGVKHVDNPARFGVVVLDDNYKVRKMIEKPQEPVSNLALVGLYYIKNPKMLVDALDELITKDIKTKGEYQLTDALQIMVDKGEVFDTFPVDGWYDCGKAETLLSTNRFLLDQKTTKRDFSDSIIIPPVFIAPNANIQRSVIGPYASVAEGAEVKDSIVKNSIVSYGAKVKTSLLHESIIGNDAIISGTFHRINLGNSSEIDHS